MDWAVYIESTYSTCRCVNVIVRSCAVQIKYCNHLLAVDMAVWHVYVANRLKT